jgi:hypothetical protein
MHNFTRWATLVIVTTGDTQLSNYTSYLQLSTTQSQPVQKSGHIPDQSHDTDRYQQVAPHKQQLWTNYGLWPPTRLNQSR